MIRGVEVRRSTTQARARRARRWRAALASAVAALAGFGPLPARAGIYLETQTRDPRRSEIAERSGRIWIDGPKLRMESRARGASKAERVLIYQDEGGGQLLEIDPVAQSYRDVDRESLTRIATEAARIRSESEVRLLALPEAERETLRRMLEASSRAESSLPLESRETDDQSRVGGRECRVHTLHQADENVGEVCVATFSSLGLARPSLRVFRGLADFQRSLRESLGRSPGGELGRQPFEIFDRIGGFPLRTRRIEAGEVVAETLFVNLQQADGSAELFAIPPGYQLEPSATGALPVQR